MGVTSHKMATSSDQPPLYRAGRHGVTCGFGIRDSDSGITMLETARTSSTKKCLGVFSNEWNVSFCQLRNISSYTAMSCTQAPCLPVLLPTQKYKSHDVTHLHRPSGTKLNLRGFWYSLCSAILNFVHLFEGLLGALWRPFFLTNSQLATQKVAYRIP